jgi:serine protein kinase
VAAVYEESDAYPIYEGRIGASPREMRVVLMDAAQSPTYRCLSPLAVLAEIDALCQRRAEFEWLQQDPLGGGYHDVRQFVESLQSRLYDAFEQELYSASGLVEEERYAELFDRYVQHVSSWVKKERIRNKLTGEYEEPDANLMSEVERLLDVKGDPEDARKALISGIAAWALDHPGQKVEPGAVFPQQLRRIRDAIYAERRGLVAQVARDLVILVRDEGRGLDATRRAARRPSPRFAPCRSATATVRTAQRTRRASP